jgi:anhydro-N-acetylmuramic acid kinase
MQTISNTQGETELSLSSQASKNFYWSIGLMSGTSIDGIDAALIYTNGHDVTQFGASIFHPYDADMRTKLTSVLGKDINDTAVKPVENEFTQLNSAVVRDLLKKASMNPEEVRIIGFHGHTLWHKSHRVHGEGATCQMGDGALLARETGIDVVCDFRSADVAAGGEGAPLVPIYHHALFKLYNDRQKRKGQKPLPNMLFINIGGVANITYVESGGAEKMVAFDTGPGGCLIDEWMELKAGLPYDKDGETALQGVSDDEIYCQLEDQCHLDQPPPKSFDRLDFTRKAMQMEDLLNLDLCAGAATVTILTSVCIVHNTVHLQKVPLKWVVCGGGRNNLTIMDQLREAGTVFVSGEVRVMTAEKAKFDGDMIEAQAFAYLAARHLAGLPLSYPGTTGVKTPQCGGRLYLAL